jgi:predicted SnoaL-like aldol condensation-catalyzing enzyme
MEISMSICEQKRRSVNSVHFVYCLAGLVLAAVAGPLQAQVPPTGVDNQAALLASPDPKLAANKRLVYDMYRVLIQGGHTELAARYFTEGYIQHNPNVPSGRDALVKFMRESRPVRPIAPNITFPLIAIVAEGDMVVVATVTYGQDPQDAAKKYATTHFDMYRIEGGKIAEHWDNLPKNSSMLHTDPNVATKP